jgi:phage protein U
MAEQESSRGRVRPDWGGDEAPLKAIHTESSSVAAHAAAEAKATMQMGWYCHGCNRTRCIHHVGAPLCRQGAS